jgi:hypothetical protein
MAAEKKPNNRHLGRQVDTEGWLQPGGPLPPMPASLKGKEKAYYKTLVEHMELVGVGGYADQLLVIQTAKLMARKDRVEAEVSKLKSVTVIQPSGTMAVHPAAVELDRLESKLKDHFAGLYLTPRTRGSTKLSRNEKGMAGQKGLGVPVSATTLKMLG